jgi:hypothetical protein
LSLDVLSTPPRARRTEAASFKEIDYPWQVHGITLEQVVDGNYLQL